MTYGKLSLLRYIILILFCLVIGPLILCYVIYFKCRNQYSVEYITTYCFCIIWSSADALAHIQKRILFFFSFFFSNVSGSPEYVPEFGSNPKMSTIGKRQTWPADKQFYTFICRFCNWPCVRIAH